jgi:predicted  nucleic acid-binding Zn-ribbon protein
VTPAQAQLLLLQDLDSEIDALVHKREHLPERAAVAEQSRTVDALRRQAADRTGELRQLEAQRSKIEAELAATDERRRTVSGRLYAAQTTSARDLAAMQAEVESLASKVSDLEDEILGLLDAADAASGALADLDASIGPADSSLSRARAELARAEGALDAELSELRGRRTAAAGDVSEGLLRRYEALRARLGGVAVARVVARRCSGCHLTLSSMELERVRHAGDDLETCEQCSRILIVEPPGQIPSPQVPAPQVPSPH